MNSYFQGSKPLLNFYTLHNVSYRNLWICQYNVIDHTVKVFFYFKKESSKIFIKIKTKNKTEKT